MGAETAQLSNEKISFEVLFDYYKKNYSACLLLLKFYKASKTVSTAFSNGDHLYPCMFM